MEKLDDEIAKLLHGVTEPQKRRLLEFARETMSGELRGIPGQDLLTFAGRIPKEDLEKMRQAIEEGCERHE